MITRLVDRLLCVFGFHAYMLTWREKKPIVVCLHCGDETTGFF